MINPYSGLITFAIWVCCSAVMASTESFTNPASSADYTVPAGVQAIDVVVRGAGGGGHNTSEVNKIRGGHGAVVTVTIPTTPGETLEIGVGSGGAGGGGGGGGGGMSYIKRGTDYIVIAGGGGGAASGPAKGGDGAEGNTEAGGNGQDGEQDNAGPAQTDGPWVVIAGSGGRGGNGIANPGAGGQGTAATDNLCLGGFTSGCSNGENGTAYNGGNGSSSGGYQPGGVAARSALQAEFWVRAYIVEAVAQVLAAAAAPG